MIVHCRFPFPPHDPPVAMPEPCREACPNYDRAAFDARAKMRPDDKDLRRAIDSFLSWFYSAEASPALLDEVGRYAAQLYMRSDHSGTCIPKTVLFAHYKGVQISGPEGIADQLSTTAQRALRGEEVASWPDGELASGDTWNALFAAYGRGYE
jgi:hypothetical protein